ncbi:MAG: carboxypeptidase-like regulatory domain-containing protein [Burkholderiales bacterium]|nr:carboxypeptidase-like regulatory domain-containing protein [Bacteroidia bacterium]
MLVLLYAGLSTNAQDSLRKISGKIIDVVTKQPISFAVVTDFETNLSFQTNEQGYFEKSTNKKVVILIITKLGYESQTVKINQLTKLPLTITMKIRTVDLSEVSIVADKPVKRLVDNSFYILDYQFTDNNIILLGEMDHKQRVKLIELNGKEICRLWLKNKKYESVFKDCFNNIHLVSKFYTSQVYFDNLKLNLLDSVRRSLFDSLLVPCILDNNDNLYFESLLDKKQTKTFFVINKLTKKASGIGIFSDEFKIKMLKNEAAFLVSKYGQIDEKNTMEDVSAGDLKASRKKEDDINFAARVIYTDAYIPILLNNDTITVFNHPNGLIHQYSTNNIEVDLQIMEYSHYKNWKPLVISDEIKHKYYTTYLP